MATTIEAHEHPLGDIFDDEYSFTIPLYQRPYSWTTEHAGELLDDVLSFARADGELGELDPYFLGSLVLTKERGVPAADVVDGQQRLTTLTILFSVLRHFVSEKWQVGLDKRLWQEGDVTKGLADRPRLRLRDLDHEFFARHIHKLDGLVVLRSLEPAQVQTEAQANIRANALLFAGKLAELESTIAERLAAYLTRMTYLVVVATPDFDSAYRIFSVLNERGLDLSHTDVFKSEIVGRIPEGEKELYTKRWEAEEEDLGREDFADLFGHIRMVHAKTKQRETILKEFRSTVLNSYEDGREFVDNVLVPYSDAFEVVTRESYQATQLSDQVNHSLSWLNRLDNSDWIPPAIEYMRRFGNEPATLLTFLRDLDRLASSLFIRRVDLTRRIERYAQLLKAIEAGDDLSSPGSPLRLTDEECAQTRQRLAEDVYLVTRVRSYVLLRLDEAMSEGSASYDYPVVSVEHVLPQNPSDGSHWLTDFTPEQREYWTHKLANLVLLSRRRNTQASNRPFDEKKETYFRTTEGGSPFVITTQVLKTAEWTPTVLEARQQEVLAKLESLWRL